MTDRDHHLFEGYFPAGGPGGEEEHATLGVRLRVAHS
jgi:hypothetical protein